MGQLDTHARRDDNGPLAADPDADEPDTTVDPEPRHEPHRWGWSSGWLSQARQRLW